MFLRYYEFSKEHPEYFALMFLDRSVPRISRDYERFGFVGQMKHDMIERIQQAIDAGACPPDTPAHVVFRLCLTAVHGAATLKLCDRLAPGEDADLLARATIDTVLKGLRAGAGRNLNFRPAFIATLRQAQGRPERCRGATRTSSHESFVPCFAYSPALPSRPRCSPPRAAAHPRAPRLPWSRRPSRFGQPRWNSSRSIASFA